MMRAENGTRAGELIFYLTVTARDRAREQAGAIRIGEFRWPIVKAVALVTTAYAAHRRGRPESFR